MDPVQRSVDPLYNKDDSLTLDVSMTSSQYAANEKYIADLKRQIKTEKKERNEKRRKLAMYNPSASLKQ